MRLGNQDSVIKEGRQGSPSELRSRRNTVVMQLSYYRGRLEDAQDEIEDLCETIDELENREEGLVDAIKQETYRRSVQQ